MIKMEHEDSVIMSKNKVFLTSIAHTELHEPQKQRGFQSKALKYSIAVTGLHEEIKKQNKMRSDSKLKYSLIVKKYIAFGKQ